MHVFLKLQAQKRNKQNHLAKHTPGQAKVVIAAWNCRKYILEKQFQTNAFEFFYECI